MNIIGTFQKRADGGYSGSVQTLFREAAGVELRPISRATDNGPDFRLIRGEVECGAAWAKTSRDGRDFVSVKMDDPSLMAPIFANLVEAEDGYALIWSRRRNGE